MALTTALKDLINRGLRPLNLRLDTLTGERIERARLERLAAGGWFDSPVFPVPPAFPACDAQPIFDALAAHAGRLRDLARADQNPVGFSLDNEYCTSPDAEVLYCMIRRHRPGRIVEIGSGHSTRLARLAIADGGLSTVLTAIDPHPRQEVTTLADVVCPAPVESVEGRAALGTLEPGDLLFIDSSHEIRPGNDVVTLWLDVVPRLPPGVLVHAHDVFLPWDYPAGWVVDAGWPWNEQYLVQALLEDESRFDVLWPGHYLQRTRPGFGEHFPAHAGRPATSLWLRTR